MRYFLELSYKGTRYNGWQVQPNAPSVQATIEAALSTLLNTNTELVGCGRTDAGVHATQYFAHFDAEKALPNEFAYRLNRILPPDIAIHRLIDTLPPDAHARFGANYRAYHYHIHLQKNPFLADQSYYFSMLPLDVAKMQQAAKLLLNYTDFRAFCKADSDAKHYLCHLFESQITLDEQQQTLLYRVAANRFLRGMVRLIVGSLLMVGKNKISLDEYQHVLHQKLPKFNGTNLSVPPQGLFLVDIRYPFV
jgi:tRNA pseudouridine38-40 synthase